MSEKKINIEKLLDSLWDLSSDNQILDDMLIADGYNPEKLEKSGVTKIKKLIFQNQVALKKRVALKLYTKALEVIQLATIETKEAILGLLKSKSPSFQFRNLENLDVENLKQILNETELLDLMDKIEKDTLNDESKP